MADGLGGRDIHSIAEDGDHNIWLGLEEGAQRISRSAFTTFTAVDGLPPVEPEGSASAHISSVFQDRSGALCITTAGNGRAPFLSHLEGERFRSIYPNLPRRTDLGWGTHQIALQDHVGDWWFASMKGLCRFGRPVRFEQLAYAQPKAFYTISDGLAPGEIFRVMEDSRGDIWIATIPNGLTRWDRRTASFRRYTEDDGGPKFEQLISAFAEDHAGDVWMGLWGGGAARFRGGKFARFGESDGIGAGTISDVYCDRAGRLWIGSVRGGVTRVDSPENDRPRFTNISVRQGLSSYATQCLTEDRLGRIYVGGGRGIDRLDPGAAPGAGPSKHYTTADGLAYGDLREAFADQEGNLWFGTTLGVSRLVPTPDPARTPPVALINELRIHGVPYPLSDLGVSELTGIRIKPDQANVQVSFLALSFEPGSVLKYQYMLAGADRDWGALTEQRTVNYASLAPGSYRFLVRAMDSAGVTASKPATIDLTILPPIWQRWWFLVLCACAVISSAYGIHRYRVAHLLQLERVRTRIATDLHDDIGASLSQIAVVSEVLSQRGNTNDQFREPLSQIATDSRELVASMSDIVWAIDPRRDHLHDLVQRMRRFASDMFTARDIQFQFAASAADLRLSTDQRRHMFLVFKEAVNNIVRHSDCTEAEISLELQANMLVLRVGDNGRGIDSSRTSSGNGLSSMRARAEALGGGVEVTQGEDRGTRITLKVPLNRLHKHRI